MEIQQIRNELENLPDLIWSAEWDYREAKAEENHMQDLKKVVLSHLKTKFYGTNADKETLAISSPKYQLHLDGLKESALDTGRKEARFHNLQNKFEAMRSLNKNV